QLVRESEDSIFTVLGEFGTAINAATGGTPRPVHKQIPQPDRPGATTTPRRVQTPIAQPDRAVDNTTIWAPDFNQAPYTALLFDDAPGQNSMRNFYKEQSSNRYTVNGEATNWVQVPFNEARYGTNLCGSNVCSTVWSFVRDSLTAWYNGQIAAGKSPAQIDEYLKKFDVWDRYDYDGDGNFDESDGYIHHFQSIHAVL